MLYKEKNEMFTKEPEEAGTSKESGQAERQKDSESRRCQAGQEAGVWGECNVQKPGWGGPCIQCELDLIWINLLAIGDRLNSQATIHKSLTKA